MNSNDRNSTVSRSDIREAFQSVSNIEVDNQFEDTCVEICTEHGLVADGIVNEWELLALKYPEADSHTILERLKSKFQNESSKRNYRRFDSPVRNSGNQLKTQEMERVRTPTPVNAGRSLKRVKGKSFGPADFIPFNIHDSPVATQKGQKKSKGTDASPIANPPISPVSASRKYSDRPSIGKVELSFNEEFNLLNCSLKKSTALTYEILDEVPDEKYMHYTVQQRAELLEEQLSNAKLRYKEIYGWLEDDFASVGSVTQTDALFCGRICCEAHEGRPNSKSLMLEGSRSDSNGMRVRLNLDANLKSYSLFPGQVVVVRGICPDRESLFVNQIFDDLKLTKNREKDPSSLQLTSDSPTTLVVACGPFTVCDDIEYEPLEDLLGNIREIQPNFVLLMGPFLDYNNQMIAKAECIKTLPNGEKVNIQYFQLFESILSRMESTLEDINTQVFIVPSVADVMHQPCFPQRRFDVDMKSLGLGKQGKIVCLSNPTTIKLHDITVGISTQDIVKELASNEVSKADKMQNPATRKPRVHRLVNHILKQASFYPLFPPAEDGYVDSTKQDHFGLKAKPDLLILSSILQFFSYDVEGSVCINPGKLTRGLTGGVYAKIAATKKNKVAESQSENVAESQSENVAAEDDTGAIAASDTKIQVEIVRI